MKIYLKLSIVLIFAQSLIFSGCGKYEDGPGFSLRTKKARLTGEWEVVEVDGDKVKDGSTIEFNKDGTFKVDYGSSTSKGDWNWEKGKTEIELDYDKGGKTEFEILRLTNKELWVEDEYKTEIYFEKVK